MIALFPNCAFLSETSRMLAIHAALRGLGMPVCIATHGGPWQVLLERAGVPWEQVGPPMDAARCARFVRSLPGIGAPNQSLYADDEMLAYARAEAAYMRRREVRLAVTGFTLTTLLSSRLAGVPLAASHAGSWVPPVYEAGLLPAPSRPVAPAMRWLPRRLQRWLVNAMPARSGIYCAGFNRAARILGVEGVPSFAALLLADLTLVTDCAEILGIDRATLENWRPTHRGYRPATTLRYTGPLYARFDVPVPERVERWLDGDGAVAYVALTSSSAALVRSTVAAVRAAGCRVLVAATLHDLADLDDPPRVLVEPLLPSHRLMPRVALAVITGGQGSVQTAMAAGVPMLGIPLQPEQDLNVHLAERQGMAIRLAPRLAGSAAMTAAVRALLDRPHYREQARRVRAIVAPIDGARGAALAIRDYLAEPAATLATAAAHAAA